MKKEVKQMTNIYVGNLPYSVTNDTLESVFTKYGTVESAIVITDQQSGRSKGFGFVKMPEDDKAQEAITALNESELEGRKLIVNVARPKN
jgi:RNA recognition motif-containing protein